MKSKWGRKIFLIFKFILATIIIINMLGLVLNFIFFKDELQLIEPYGEMIDVNGSKMHVYSMGSGEKTIVLLSGFGVPLPSADFGPLMRELSKNYKVVTVEYFGTGFSEEIDTPRTNENYTNEIRIALDRAGFKPPYVLMPHSASGIYSEYYATKYPEEISSIIMLDTTSTSKIEEVPSYVKFAYTIGKFQQATGATRITINLIPETKLIKNGYTQEEILDYKKFSYHTINDTMINQFLMMMENIKEVNNLPFPKDTPVLKIISKEAIDKIAKIENTDGMEYQNNHLSRLGDNVSYKIVDATHFVYQTNVDDIVKLTNDFLSETNK